MPETYETVRILTYIQSVITKYSSAPAAEAEAGAEAEGKESVVMEVPEEFEEFLNKLDIALTVWEKVSLSLSMQTANDIASHQVMYWDACATAREKYRAAVSVTFTGKLSSKYSGPTLATLLERVLAKLQDGIARALATTATTTPTFTTTTTTTTSTSSPTSKENNQSGSGSGNGESGRRTEVTYGGISPTYFYYECTDYKLYRSDIDIDVTSMGAAAATLAGIATAAAVISGQPAAGTAAAAAAAAAPTQAQGLAFTQHTLPLFLEGPVRHMKILQTSQEKRAVYQAVKASALYDSGKDQVHMCGVAAAAVARAIVAADEKEMCSLVQYVLTTTPHPYRPHLLTLPFDLAISIANVYPLRKPGFYWSRCWQNGSLRTWMARKPIRVATYVL